MVIPFRSDGRLRSGPTSFFRFLANESAPFDAAVRVVPFAEDVGLINLQ